MRIKQIIFLLLCCSWQLQAQNPFPEKGEVFDATQVARVDIIIHPDSLDIILESGNEWSNHEFPATFIYINSGDIDTVNNVGFRLRGNTSRNADKKSFKVSFNSFVDQKFHGLEKMNLNGEHNDPCIARSKIFWDIAYDFGIIGSRINHCELYINNEYKGLYVNVEHIDEEFVDLRFGNKDGNLFKCTYPADLVYMDSNPNSYKFESNGRRAYELITNKEIDDYTDLANFIDVINNTNINNLRTELEPIFNVNAFLKYYAFEVLCGHWDAYAINKNNFYLYNNQGVFEIIPYDGDNTFGIDWFGIDWGNRDVNDWASDWEARPLVKRLLQVPEYQARFNFYLNELLAASFKPSSIFPVIDALKIQINPFIDQDNYYSMDYGWTIYDFAESYIYDLGDHVTYGLRPYFSSRYYSALGQLDLDNVSPIISSIHSNQPTSGQLLGISAKIEDEFYPLSAYLNFQYESGVWDSIPLYDDGNNNDVLPEDGRYGGLISTDGFIGQINYYISAVDDQNAFSRQPFIGELSLTVAPPSPYPLYINELLARNQQVNADNYGEYDDWIELYNQGDNTIQLDGFYLTDDENDSLKWALPAIDLMANEYVIFWADKDSVQGPEHCNFKLNGGGESIWLYYQNGGVIQLVDHVVFEDQINDQSIGRFPNGTGPIQVLSYPTPAASNIPLEINSLVDIESLQVYPNPFKSYCEISLPHDLKGASIQVMDVFGNLLWDQKVDDTSVQWYGTNHMGEKVPSGVYLLRVNGYQGEASYQATSKVVLIN